MKGNKLKWNLYIYIMKVIFFLFSILYGVYTSPALHINNLIVFVKRYKTSFTTTSFLLPLPRFVQAECVENIIKRVNYWTFLFG